MKVLLVYNLYNPRKPNISGYDMKLRGSFESAFENNPEHSYEVLYFGFEPGFIKDAKTLNEELLKRDFDICVVSEELKFYVYLKTAKKLGKKLFLNIWDIWVAIASDDYVNFRIALKQRRTWGEHINPHSILKLSEYCNLLICGYGIDEILPNVYGIMNTVDTRLYYPKFDTVPEYDISHNGTLYIPERYKYYRMLRKTDLNVSYFGNNSKIKECNGKYLSDEEYSDIFRKSKISLCFTESIFGSKHREKKGRISEIASCGGFMLMTHPEIFNYRGKKLFEEGVHFDSIDLDNCIDKIKYYLENEEKRKTMARAFYERWMETHSPKVYWEKIFEWSK